MTEQFSLMDTSGMAPPIFGVQASWLCFGKKLWEICIQRTPESTDYYAEAYDLAALAYLYRHSMSGPVRIGRPSRIQCPALDFDRTGAFMDIWPDFIRIATMEAERIMGIVIEEGDSCVTTAWQGETRMFINNICNMASK